ncbi:zinc-dependent alcohol dehydrogenase [Virgisporangium aurantiacum]|uniref:Galactitol-1-phosphate 5-dehydrogenase n=1 Tax=Virgisporangium aurantiacum TaxID=175570 RepID=A0A8J4DXJ8_9ACTN|nr:zinc-binding dehydrogenase [Virgisporangium aurantiacum]GIJ54610.1 galactitol-1-phosphate 5-dehydrogenase [Virgisporangium aurantiacum]
MRAAVLHGFGKLVVDEVADPVPRPDEVVVDVTCVQPSVTECGLVLGEPIAMHAQLARALADGPVRFGGHEFCGVVSEAGADSGVAVGATVTAVETIHCGRCAACRRARPDACARPEFIGFTRPGAFAERVAVPAASVVPVPAGVSASAVAAIQPLAGAIHAHAEADIRPGESVLVIGAGVMGLLAIQVARHGNAGVVIVAGRSPAKLALAERFGADVVLGADADVRRAVRDATDGIGADVVIETAGGPPEAGLAGVATLDLAARCVRRGGRIVMVSVLPQRFEAPVGLLRERSVALLHPRSGAGGYSPAASVFEYALRLVARGDVDVESLVTHRLHGIDALPEAVEMTANKAAHGAINPVQVVLP